MEEFPLSEHDDCVDAYTWAQAGFVRGDGFFKPQALRAGEGVIQYDSALDRWEGEVGNFDFSQMPEVMGDATRFALNRSSRSLNDILLSAIDAEGNMQ